MEVADPMQKLLSGLGLFFHSSFFGFACCFHALLLELLVLFLLILCYYTCDVPVKRLCVWLLVESKMTLTMSSSVLNSYMHLCSNDSRSEAPYIVCANEMVNRLDTSDIRHTN